MEQETVKPYDAASWVVPFVFITGGCVMYFIIAWMLVGLKAAGVSTALIAIGIYFFLFRERKDKIEDREDYGSEGDEPVNETV